MIELVPPPPLGLHQDIPFEEYKQWDALNASTLALGHKGSPMHMKAGRDGTMDSETRARKFGLAVHVKLLEPKRFAEVYRVPGRCTATIVSGKRKGEQCGNWANRQVDEQWLCGVHAPRDWPEAGNVLTTDELHQIESIHTAVLNHDIIRLLRQHGGHEVSAMWSLEGIPSKSRFDKLIQASTCPTTVVDIKKTQVLGGTEEAWPYSVSTYKYDIQAAFYCDAVAQLLGEEPNVVWIVVEEKPPHAVSVFPVDDLTIEIGRDRYKRQVARFKECEAEDFWPGPCYDVAEGRYQMRPSGLPQREKNQYLQRSGAL